MPERQPPLNWLRAFEAAGRAGSVKRAAEELNVTPSTISHQIRDLEAMLGLPLFDRSGRGLQLTREGAGYLDSLSAGFQLIREARPTVAEASETIALGAFPFLANEVITPSLRQLRAKLNVGVRVFTKTDLELLAAADPKDRLDVIVTYARRGRRFPGYVHEWLADVAIVPIVPPGTGEILQPAELLTRPLIRVLGPFQGWQRWHAAFCPEQPMPQYALETDSFHSAVLAVERGEGVSLGVLPQIGPWLKAGRVQGLGEYALPVEDESTYAFFAPHHRDDPRVAEIVAWLRNLLG